MLGLKRPLYDDNRSGVVKIKWLDATRERFKAMQSLAGLTKKLVRAT